MPLKPTALKPLGSHGGFALILSHSLIPVLNGRGQSQAMCFSTGVNTEETISVDNMHPQSGVIPLISPRREKAAISLAKTRNGHNLYESPSQVALYDFIL